MLVNNAGVGIGGADGRDRRPSTSTCSSAVNLRALIIGTREGLPLLREAGAEHGKALIVNTASIAGKGGPGLALDLRRDQGRGDQLHASRPSARSAAPGSSARRWPRPSSTRAMTEFVKGQVPAEEMIQPADIGEAVRFLLRTSPQLPRAGDRLHPARRGRSTLPERRRVRAPASLRVLVAAFGDPGHVFPAIALGRALAGRGHEVVVETWEERRGAVEGAGLGFAAAEEYRMFPPPEPDSADGRHAAEAARALLPLLEELRPDVVVSDILTLAPGARRRGAGVPLATLIPHIYPVVEPGLPFFAIGLRPPRTPLGRAVWRAGQRALDVGLEHGRRDLNQQRRRLGLPPIERFHGGISPDLALVATYPQLEYPRALAGRGRGDRADDLRAAPPGDRAAAGRARRWSWSPPAPPTTPRTTSSARRWRRSPSEPVRVVATTNRVAPAAPDRGPGQRRPRRLAQLQPADAGGLAGRSPTAATAPSPAPSAPAPRS